ncbi:hypothetical protein [Methanobrevibacter curvatus]|uniref:hypothetical protein n=1 Tax=Methanobrevibacter curvatus TaxID=49547 RepID=UPI000834D1A8|nr:hypothetical protein [Methanobrevibacter curvatus]
MKIFFNIFLNFFRRFFILKKSIFVFIAILSIFILIGSVSAAIYSISNSTDSDTISKMISGKIPIKYNKFIKNGDVVKFHVGKLQQFKTSVLTI